MEVAISEIQGLVPTSFGPVTKRPEILHVIAVSDAIEGHCLYLELPKEHSRIQLNRKSVEELIDRLRSWTYSLEE